ncbi:VTT domain-containing protein [Chloroflexota bacterium]
MKNLNNKSQQSGEAQGKLRRVVIPVITLLLVISLSMLLFLFRDKIAAFGNYGYLGAFLISLVANATIILPMPGLLILMSLGTIYNPVLVGLIGGLGGAIGEMTGYTAGRSGRGLAGGKKMYDRAEVWMKKRGFITIFLFSLLPFLPLDLAGMVGGVLRYSPRKFLLACFLGKSLLYIVLIQTGAWGFKSMLRFFG